MFGRLANCYSLSNDIILVHASSVDRVRGHSFSQPDIIHSASQHFDSLIEFLESCALNGNLTMPTLLFTVAPSGAAYFHDLLTCLAKFDEDVSLEATPQFVRRPYLVPTLDLWTDEISSAFRV